MPWIEIGRFSFDLAEVVLVARGIKADGADSQQSVTVSLRCGKDVELLGDEARVFLASFAEYTASRALGGKPPPELIRGEVRVLPPRANHETARESSTGAHPARTPSP